VKATKRVPQPDSDHIHEFPLGRTVLVSSTEVSLRGKRGRFRFRYARVNAHGVDELTFCGGPLHGQRERFVSVYPDAITRVHRDRKTLANIQLDRRVSQ